MLLILAGVLLLVWLNGPGIRWLLPKIASHFLEKQSMSANFSVSGSVLSGISIHDLRLVGGPVVALSIKEIQPHYHWRELIHGEIRGLAAHEINVDVDLDRTFPQTKKAEPEVPFDLAKLIESIRAARSKTLAYDVDFITGSIRVHRSEKDLVTVKPSSFFHKQNSSDWIVSLGTIKYSERQDFPAQKIHLEWSENGLFLDQVGLSDDVKISGITFSTPADLKPAVSATVDVVKSQFFVDVKPDVSSISIALQNGELFFDDVSKLLGKDLPVTGRMSKFSLALTPQNLPIHGISNQPMTTDLTMNLQVNDVIYEGRKIDQCLVSINKIGSKANIEVKANALGGELNTSAALLWEVNPTNLDQCKNVQSELDLTIPNIQPILIALKPDLKIPNDKVLPLPPVGAIRLKGNYKNHVSRLGDFKATLAVTPENSAIAPLEMNFSHQQENPLAVELKTVNLTANANYDVANRTYQAEAVLSEWIPDLLLPWIAWMDKSIPSGIKASLAWKGSGSLKASTHRGEADLSEISFVSEAIDAINAKSQMSYDWPSSVKIENFSVRQGTQELKVDAVFADQVINISQVSLADRGQKLIQGKAHIPIPQTINSLDDFLAQKNMLEVSMKTEVLPMSTWNNWLPKDSPLPISGTTELDLQISGSPAAPLINAEFRAKDVRSLQRADLPPADLILQISTEAQVLKMNGQLLNPRTPPTSLSAKILFRPGEWAKSPELLKSEIIDASLQIPKLDLTRFKDLIPGVKEIAGLIDGNVTVRGTVGAPDIRGQLDLTGFKVTLPNEKVPPITNTSARLTFADRVARLDSLSATLAGGEIKASGTMKIPAIGEPSLDLSIRGNALPLWRDAAVIVRADADLKIAGSWQTVRISGPIKIVDSMLYKDFEIIPIGKPFTLPQAASLPALDTKISDKVESLPAPFGKWALDLTIKTENSFLVRGNLAHGSIVADVRVGGTLANPLPDGSATIKSLTAALPLSKLTIQSGIVRLTPATGLDPILDIRGTSKASNYDVNLYVYGAVSAPKILLTSEPPLPENEIMTLLATGTTTSGLGNGSTAQTKAMQLLIEEFRRGRLPMGKRLLPLLSKLEDVEIAFGDPDPYTGKKYASAKVPISSKYFVSGSVDGEGLTRSLLIFELKFR